MAIDGASIGDYAQQFLGTKYVWGGNDLRNGIDCSGLVQQVFKHFGISLPRVTYDQIGQGAPVSLKGLRAGDLVFFDTDGGRSGPDHVGIYLGNGKMIHAPRPGKSVEISDITKGYYLDKFMGGRRISGVHATGASSSDYQDTPKLSPEELASSYGWAYGFLNSNPELKKLFNSAVKETWTADKFKAELRDTKWWKSNSETRRQAQVTQKTDPATWQAQLQAGVLKVRQLAAEIGAAIPENKISAITKNAIETGIIDDEGQMRNALGGYVTFTKDGTLKGEAAMHEYTMRQFAYDNGIQISDQAIKNQAQLVVKKLATTEDFQNQVRQQAVSMFPSYQKQIEAGVNVSDIASPYMQMMSQELEMPYQGIDVTDPIIKQALNGMDKSGKPVGTTLSDFQQQLRNDPRWKKTTAAQNSTMSVGLSVLRDMGLVGNPAG